MNEAQKYIKVLREQVNKLMQISCAEDFDNWQNQTEVFITRIYGEKSRQRYSFYNISPRPGSYVMGKPIPDESARAKKEANSFIEGVIIDLEISGLPNNTINIREERQNININNNISQTQHVGLSFIIKTIKNELPPARLDEIEDIISKEESQESKLKKVGDVLKSAGIEVLSSTLAKIITQATGVPVA